MRILVLSSFYPPHHLGGYEIACESAVRGLRERGHEVRVLAGRYRNPDVAGDDDEVDRELNLFWEAGEWRRPGLAGAVRATRQDLGAFGLVLERFHPHVVWAWQMAALSKSLLTRCFERRVPVALSFLDLWPLYDVAPDPWLRWTGRARRPVGRALGALFGLPTRPLDLRTAAAASFCSDWLRAQVAGAGIVPEGPVIHPGVDPSLFAPAPGRDTIRRFLVVGRVEPRKGPAVAVEALARARAAGIGDATLTVWGRSEGGHREELESLARRLGVTEAVTFGQTAVRNELPSIYAEHDAVIHAATWEEPFGLTLLEAMACGRPVIASPTGGAREFVSDSNSLTFPPGDVDACAKRMWQLASDPSRAPRLVEAGLQTAARFTERAATDAHEEQLRSVVAP
jgi:glycogen(starch) synthase